MPGPESSQDLWAARRAPRSTDPGRSQRPAPQSPDAGWAGRPAEGGGHEAAWPPARPSTGRVDAAEAGRFIDETLAEPTPEADAPRGRRSKGADGRRGRRSQESGDTSRGRRSSSEGGERGRRSQESGDAPRGRRTHADGESSRGRRRSADGGDVAPVDGTGEFGESPWGGRRGADDGEQPSAVATTSRKRRRTPRSDWQFPLLTDWGLRPDQQRLIVIIASIVGVLAAGAGLAAILGSLGDYAPEQEANAAVLDPDASLPMIYQGWSSPKLFDALTDRSKDSRALTEKEVFGQSELAVSKKLKLKLVAKQLDADCSKALWGGTLVGKAADAGCTQAARGLYASSDGRYVGQYTLLNLKDGQSATDLVQSLKTLYRGGWARPLTSTKAAFPAEGYSEGGGYALGHYVGLVWLARTDGLDATAKDDFVSLALALRGAEKSVYRRVVAITGPPS